MNDFTKHIMDICDQYKECQKCPLWKKVKGKIAEYRICDLTSEASGIIEELEYEVHRNDKQE